MAISNNELRTVGWELFWGNCHPWSYNPRLKPKANKGATYSTGVCATATPATVVEIGTSSRGFTDPADAMQM